MVNRTCPVPGGVMGVPPGGCSGFLHWLMHTGGVDTQNSYFYDFVSGVGPMLLTAVSVIAIFATAVAAYRRWSCRRSFWCPRHGHYPLTDPDTGETRSFCHVHHPGVTRKHWKPHHVEDVWRRHLAARTPPEGPG